MTQQKVISSLTAGAVGLLLLAAIAYMLHSLTDREAASTLTPTGPQRPAAQGDAADAKVAEEPAIHLAEIPWCRIPNRPESAIVTLAQMPWVRRSPRPAGGVYIYQATLPVLQRRRDPNKPDLAAVEVADCPWLRRSPQPAGLAAGTGAIDQANTPWLQQRPQMRANVAEAIVPHLHPKRVVSKPDAAMLQLAQVPWADRDVARPEPARIFEAQLPHQLKRVPFKNRDGG